MVRFLCTKDHHFIFSSLSSPSIPPPSDLDYSDLRAEAAVHAQLRAEAFQKAARARAGKQGEVAMHYAKQVKLLIKGTMCPNILIQLYWMSC